MKSKFDETLTLFKSGKLNKAKDICVEILKQETNNSEAYNLYAFILYSLKEFEAAIESWNKAIKINPNYIEAYNGRGNAFIKLQKLDDAIINFNQAIKINPNYFEAYNNRGNAFVNLQKLNEAVASYEQAIKIKPNYAQAYYAFDSRFGGQGMANFLFSDILGDHKIQFGTEMVVDLKRSYYFIVYRLLPYKIDWNLIFYHLAYEYGHYPLYTQVSLFQNIGHLKIKNSHEL